MADCDWCHGPHAADHLCPPAAAVLRMLRERGARADMPDLELPEPIPAAELGMRLGLTPGDALLSYMTVDAATIPVGDPPAMHVAAVILSGLDADGRPVPRWVYPGTPDELDRAVDLVRRMVALAIRTARRQTRAMGGT